jgi:hypothetical protein
MGLPPPPTTTRSTPTAVAISGPERRAPPSAVSLAKPRQHGTRRPCHAPTHERRPASRSQTRGRRRRIPAGAGADQALPGRALWRRRGREGEEGGGGGGGLGFPPSHLAGRRERDERVLSSAPIATEPYMVTWRISSQVYGYLEDILQVYGYLEDKTYTPSL